jgi:ABC-type transport system involved in multi-copper enzyme maturation permease subunit
MNVWCRVATGILGLLVMLAAALRGAGCVSGERDKDTWISLISTPLTAWEMLRGKWLGCVLGLRRAYVVMALVWGTALLVGAVDPPMILATILYTAVYVSAFSWLGILCSITARTTLIATVRALMATLFLAGGFWLVIGLCCAMPLSIVFRGPSGRWMDDVAQVLLGGTPPFVLGWMPLMDYERNDMGPFAVSQYDGTMDGLGPFSPVLGLFFWIGMNALFGTLAWQAFQRVTNRARDRLAATLPRPQRPRRRFGDEDLRPAKRKPPVAKRLPPKDDDPGEQLIVED